MNRAFVAVAAAVALPLAAQEPRKTLAHDDAVLWRSFGSPVRLSPNGEWVVYVNRGQPADTLVAQSTTTPRSIRLPIGAGAPAPVVTSDGAYVIFAVAKSRSDIEYRSLRLADGDVRPLPGVRSPTFDATGRWMAYADSAGLYLRDLQSGETRVVLAGATRALALVFDREGTQLAFFANRDSLPSPSAVYDLYHATVREPAARVLVRSAAFGPDSAIVTSGGQVLAFTARGNALRFAVSRRGGSPRPAERSADSTTVELWHYEDPQLPSERRRDAFGLPRVLHMLYDLQRGRASALGVATAVHVEVNAEGTYALLTDVRAKRVDATWRPFGREVVLVDVKRGSRRMLVSMDGGAGPRFSPAGRYVYWFTEGSWHTYHLESGVSTDIGRAFPPGALQEQHARNNSRRPWADPVWTGGGDDARLLVRDARDIWSVDPRLRSPSFSATDSMGVRENLAFEVLSAAADSAWAIATDLTTHAEGFYGIRVDRPGAPARAMLEDVRFAPVGSGGERFLVARDAPMYLVAKETAARFGDLWVGRRLDSLRRVTDLNPQQRAYRWPTAEVVRWRSDDGAALQGILYKPDDFDRAKEYPLVVTYYEQFSSTYHVYYPPGYYERPLYAVNPSVYTSNGYLVFVPDVVYTVGEPAQSVVRSILPGVQTLLQRGDLKVGRVGCIGVSWGGYETLVLVTRSRLFAGCVAETPSVDFTSLAGFLYAQDWSMQRYFENGQGRLGGPIWEDPQRYIANSPIYGLDRVTTPLLIIANDHDEIYPWWQGLAAFMGLRRLGKEVYLLNYRNEGHGMASRANVRDRHERVFQFFETTLKRAPKPRWMDIHQESP